MATWLMFLQDGDFITFTNKHDFGMIGFGMLCGMLLDSLEELTVIRCNDFFDVSTWGLSAVKSLRSLKSLRLEEVKCSAENGDVINRLSTLSKVLDLTRLACPLILGSMCEHWICLLQLLYVFQSKKTDLKAVYLILKQNACWHLVAYVKIST